MSIETLEHDIAGGIAEAFGLSDDKRQWIYEFVRENIKRAKTAEQPVVIPQFIEDMKARIAKAKQSFVFVCEKDFRLATPDYAKYRDAQIGFNIAEEAISLIQDYEDVLADKRRLTKEIDVALNGDGAAEQASLCDIVAQVKAIKRESVVDKSAEWMKDVKREQKRIEGLHEKNTD